MQNKLLFLAAVTIVAVAMLLSTNQESRQERPLSEDPSYEQKIDSLESLIESSAHQDSVIINNIIVIDSTITKIAQDEAVVLHNFHATSIDSVAVIFSIFTNPGGYEADQLRRFDWLLRTGQ